MDSNVKLQDDGLVELTGDKVKADVGFSGGTVEVSGSNFNMSVTNVEMSYFGGHLRAKDGNVEIGTSDSGVFKGFSQLKDGTVQIAGDSLKAIVGSAAIGNDSSGKFKGVRLSEGGAVYCYTYFVVLNPDVHANDGQERVALMQTADDELLVNANGRYQGGVKFEGPVHLSGNLSLQGEMQMQPGSKLLLLLPGKRIRLPNGTWGQLTQPPTDIAEIIQSLKDKILELEDKIAALETK